MTPPKYELGERVYSNIQDDYVTIVDVHISPSSGQVIYECYTDGPFKTHPLIREEEIRDEDEFEEDDN